MKFKSKYDRLLACMERIEKELKQTYSKYYGQCGEDTKATMAEYKNSTQLTKKKTSSRYAKY